MSLELLKEEIVPQFINYGKQKFYRSIILLALQKLIAIEKGYFKGIPPHLEYLEYHNKFMILYRREGDEVYRDIAKMLRKAAHKIYRIMLKKNMTAVNFLFLNLV